MCVDQVVPGLNGIWTCGDSTPPGCPVLKATSKQSWHPAEHLKPSEYAQGCGDCLVSTRLCEKQLGCCVRTSPSVGTMGVPGYRSWGAGH